ncbi:MAG TPA: hypothetical protein VI956_07060 [Nitrospirota bacterium]|nr:hypothetical protein [Nitrospirota bacterium]
MTIFPLVIVLAALAAIIIFFNVFGKPETPKAGRMEPEEEGWEYGDVWKHGSPDEAVSEEGISYVDVLRGDTGAGYDDSLMMDLVSYLGSRGIRATFDSFSLGLEPAAIKTYVLKVEAGKEEEAIRYLGEKFKSQNPKLR